MIQTHALPVEANGYDHSRTSPSENVIAAMNEAGFFPNNLLSDGKVHRFARDAQDRKKSAWYVGHDFGDSSFAVWGDWREGTKHRYWTGRPSDPEGRQKAAEALKIIQAESRKRQEAYWSQTAAECTERWNNLSEADVVTHPYLKRKGLTRAHGARIQKSEIGSALYLKVGDLDGRIYGLQKIDENGGKLFYPGTKKAGHFHVIGDGFEGSAPIYLAEGFATGASIREATGGVVIVAFDAGNLEPVARVLRAKCPNRAIVICADDDRYGANGNPGREFAEKAAQTVGARVVLPVFKQVPEGQKWTDFNDLAQAEGLDTVKQQIEAVSRNSNNSGNSRGVALAESPTKSERPEPLIRDLPPSEPYPIDCLGEILAPATRALMGTVQAPDALIGQSFLAAAAFVVQAHRNVLVDGRDCPISLSCLSIAESGERKSAIDQLVVRAIREHEKRLAEQYGVDLGVSEIARASYEQMKAAAIKSSGTPPDASAIAQTLGSEPLQPLTPILLVEEPTFEGLQKLFEHGQASLGLFSDEGGRMLGGHGMSEDQQLKTISGLSELWDGKRISRVRSGDGAKLLYGRRLSMHLMAQSMVAQTLLSNRLVLNQGLLSRCLTCWPQSTAGARMYRAVDPSASAEMIRFHFRMRSILETPLPLAEGKRNELLPRSLPLSADAKALFVKFHDSIEGQLGDGGPLAAVRGFANKVPEHALRIAAVITAFGDLQASEIKTKEMAAGIELVQFYLNEALRIFHASATDPDLVLAQKLLDWAQAHGVIYPVLVYQHGPNAIRDKKTAKKIIGILESHGWLIKEPDAVTINGSRRKDAWRVWRDESV